MSDNKVFDTVRAILEGEVAEVTVAFGRSKTNRRHVRTGLTYAAIPAVRIEAIAQAVHVALEEMPQ